MSKDDKMWRRYLMWFAHEHIDFRHAVKDSIFKSYYLVPLSINVFLIFCLFPGNK